MLLLISDSSIYLSLIQSLHNLKFYNAKHKFRFIVVKIKTQIKTNAMNKLVLLTNLIMETSAKDCCLDEKILLKCKHD